MRSKKITYNNYSQKPVIIASETCNDRFEIHADNTTRDSVTRFLAFFIYLTDNESGHTSFPDRDIKIQPKKGRLLMFPPTWCYPHVGEKVTDNPKYIIGSYCHVIPLTS